MKLGIDYPCRHGQPVVEGADDPRPSYARKLIQRVRMHSVSIRRRKAPNLMSLLPSLRLAFRPAVPLRLALRARELCVSHTHDARVLARNLSFEVLARRREEVSWGPGHVLDRAQSAREPRDLHTLPLVEAGEVRARLQPLQLAREPLTHVLVDGRLLVVSHLDVAPEERVDDEAAVMAGAARLQPVHAAVPCTSDDRRETIELGRLEEAAEVGVVFGIGKECENLNEGRKCFSLGDGTECAERSCQGG